MATTKSTRTGAIISPVTPPKPAPKINRDTIGQGTTDMVPGRTTRLSHSPSEIPKK